MNNRCTKCQGRITRAFPADSFRARFHGVIVACVELPEPDLVTDLKIVSVASLLAALAIGCLLNVVISLFF